MMSKKTESCLIWIMDLFVERSHFGGESPWVLNFSWEIPVGHTEFPEATSARRNTSSFNIIDAKLQVI